MRWLVVCTLIAVAGCADAPGDARDDEGRSAGGTCALGGQGGWYPVTADGWRELPFEIDSDVTLLRYKLSWDNALTGDGRFEVRDPQGTLVLEENITGGTGGSVWDQVEDPMVGTWAARLNAGTGAASGYMFQVAEYTGSMREGCGF